MAVVKVDKTTKLMYNRHNENKKIVFYKKSF